MADVQWIKLYTGFFDNRKVRMIRAQPDGNEIILFYLYLLTVAGRCNDGGRVYFSEKKPYNTFILATEFGSTEAIVEKALEYLEMVEMIERTDSELRIADWEKHQNIEGLEKIRETNRKSSQKYRERKRMDMKAGDVTVTSRDAAEKNRKEEKRKEEKRENSSTAPDDSDAVLVLPLADGNDFCVKQEDLLLWKETFPAVDVLQELKEMRVWCDANPQKRKTGRGIRRFIVNWLSKAQDESGKKAVGKDAGKPKHNFVPTEF